MSDATIFVTWTTPGFHYWPGARRQDARYHYLAVLHRHLFHFRVELDVLGDDREIEFHDLLHGCQARINRHEGNFEGRSCETLARDLAEWIEDEWPGRHPAVTVSEDGECGATIHSS